MRISSPYLFNLIETHLVLSTQVSFHSNIYAVIKLRGRISDLTECRLDLDGPALGYGTRFQSHSANLER